MEEKTYAEKTHVERRRDARGRRISTEADGSDLESNSARRSARAVQELAAEKRRKELQEFRLDQAVRRYVWQGQLERRAIRIEEETARRQGWGSF